MAEQTKKKYITSEDLKKHNQAGDLWISIQGKVYDVSDWLKSHPGGEAAILNLGGQDVTDAFIAFHPGTAWKHLETLHNGYHVSDFHVSDLSRDYRSLVAELSKRGLFERKGHVALYVILTCSAVMLAAVVYGVLACTSVWAYRISAVLLGFLWIQSTYFMHDSGHYTVTSSESCNKLIQLLFGNCLNGFSITWWKLFHNAHHIACNNLDHDPQLENILKFTVSTKFFNWMNSQFNWMDPLTRFLISYQHLTFYPVMCIGRIIPLSQTFIFLFSKRCQFPDRVGILVFWTWFPILVSFLPNWSERFIFVLISFAVTGIQQVQFSLNHLSADVYTGLPNGNNWIEKQTVGTFDISCKPYMDLFVGGLQFQLEHHLFPRLPCWHLRRVSPMVKELCKKHNLPYRRLSWWEANVRTISTLRNAGIQAKNLLWEAVNTHG